VVAILAVWIAQVVKVAALAAAAAATGLAGQAAPAAGWLAEALPGSVTSAPACSADPRALSVPVTHRSHRGAERATVRAISTTKAAASASAVSETCSTVSCEVWIRREADPST